MGDVLYAHAAANIGSLAPEDHRLRLRMLEALLFASAEPLSEEELSSRLPEGTDIHPLLSELQTAYAGRGVNLRQVERRWAFRTAEDLAFALRREVVEQKKLSRAAVETLAIIAYHQPATRAEIEDIRGVAISRGTLDVLMEAGWVRLRGRRRSPGRPVTFGTTPEFLDHFGLEAITDLPGLADLKAAGLLDPAASANGHAPEADDDAGDEEEDALIPDLFEPDDGEHGMHAVGNGESRPES